MKEKIALPIFFSSDFTLELSDFLDTGARITLQAARWPLNRVQRRIHPRQLFFEKRYKSCLWQLASKSLERISDRGDGFGA